MSVDSFSVLLLEEAKRFMEKYQESGERPQGYLHASLLLGMCSLEAHVNGICEDFLVRQDLAPWDRSVLEERSVEMIDGEFRLTERFKMQRLEDRILFLCKRFSVTPLDRSSTVWTGFKEASLLRNRLVHPKEVVELKQEQVVRALGAILAMLEFLFLALYKQPHPAGKRGVQSTLTF